jgi:hypothetical protein
MGNEKQRIVDRAGFRRRTQKGWEYLIHTGYFKNEICKGHDSNQVARALRSRDKLRTHGQSLMFRTRLPGVGMANVYCVVMEDGADEK